MNAIDVNVIDQAIDWLQNDQTAWLCTIVSTYGSSPRPPGSLFLTDGTRRVGSISGGCIEDAFVKTLDQRPPAQLVSLQAYGKHHNEGITIELPCGGHITLLVETISAKTHMAQLQQLRHHLVAGNSAQRIIKLQAQTSETLKGDPHAEKVIVTDDVVSLQYQTCWLLLLVGASAVSEQVARLGLQLGYRIQVIDTRSAYIENWSYSAIQPELAWPDVVLDAPQDHLCTAVLALSHHATLDDSAISSALETNAYYIGAMGSRASSEKRRTRLQRIEGISVQQLQKLHAPIGLNLGGKTPAEIALAIMADLTRTRHGIQQAHICYETP